MEFVQALMRRNQQSEQGFVRPRTTANLRYGRTNGPPRTRSYDSRVAWPEPPESTQSGHCILDRPRSSCGTLETSVPSTSTDWWHYRRLPSSPIIIKTADAVRARFNKVLCMIRELISIAGDLKAGRPAEPVTVRTFLGWFQAQRRGFQIVREIRRQLAEAGVVTVPDFESRWVDAPISFELAPADSTSLEPEAAALSTPPVASVDGGIPIINWVTRDATYRISKLAAANRGITSIKPDATLAEAVTLLLARDFSQLAVMTNERDVKGIVSWKSIGSRLALGRNGGAVRDFMDDHYEVKADVSIFDAIPLIRDHEYVLVRGEASKITGIVTGSDLSFQFQSLSEPFLLLSEIENLIRNMIGKKFTPPELASARDPGAVERNIETVDDLQFGEYIRLLQNPDRWAKLQIAVDRVLFCNDLDAVRKIRNDVTHFDPDGITDGELERLRHFKAFVRQLELIGN